MLCYLDDPGCGVADLPFQHMQIIDLSPSHEAVFTSLLGRVLNVERPELESQKYTMKRDVLHLNREIAHQQVSKMQFDSFYFIQLFFYCLNCSRSFYFGNIALDRDIDSNTCVCVHCNCLTRASLRTPLENLTVAYLKRK